MEESLLEIYLNKLEYSNKPEFLNKYLNVPCLKRLKKICYFCGMDYASKHIYNFKEKITRYDHSLTVALLTWKCTRDKKATLAGLFHDIATPCFSHVIDYMNKDYANQESTEENTEKILKKNKLSGWINEYKYKLSESNDGYMLVILDGSMAKQSNWSIFTTSILVSTISYLIVLFIIALFSKRAIKPIAESYEKQKQFITDASHELKTPLTIISANSEILEITYGNDEWIEGIEKQAERMRDLVNNLVVLTKMDEEKQTIIYKEFNFSDAVYDTTMAFEGLCKKNKKKLHIDIDSDISMKGDESEFRKLISILLDNAVKYCDENGNIYVRLKKEKHIVMSVRNSYKDVSNIELNRLFDRFYRVDKARTRNGSYGLGLAIAQAIIDRHKGKIKVMNIDDKMIEFEVKL